MGSRVTRACEGPNDRQEKRGGTRVRNSIFKKKLVGVVGGAHELRIGEKRQERVGDLTLDVIRQAVAVPGDPELVGDEGGGGVDMGGVDVELHVLEEANDVVEQEISVGAAHGDGGRVVLFQYADLGVDCVVHFTNNFRMIVGLSLETPL